MELYLSKIINFIFEPLNIVFAIILIQIFVIFFLDSKKLVENLSKVFLVVFLFFGYIPLSSFALSKIEDYIEPSRYPINQLTGIVVLGGSFDSGLEVEAKERNEVLLNRSSQRLTKALEIYKKNPRVLILFSGYSNSINAKSWSELEMARKFFLDQGVRVDNLIFENKSRNTFENIKFSKDIINNYRGTWGLVTSANHMPRSFFAFKKQGLVLEPISTDYKTGTSKMFWLNFSIEKGLRHWSIIFHEIIGLVYYKVTNKI
jgi:uncharacterized SAM-binding protein YcdF (DUF218 family)